MAFTEEVDSMVRILAAIDTYRCQTDDQTDLSGNESVHVYLDHHLSHQDWRIWNQWRVDLTANSPSVPEDSYLWPAQVFRQRLGQYKRAVYEQIQMGSQESIAPDQN